MSFEKRVEEQRRAAEVEKRKKDEQLRLQRAEAERISAEKQQQARATRETENKALETRITQSAAYKELQEIAKSAKLQEAIAYVIKELAPTVTERIFLGRRKVQESQTREVSAFVYDYEVRKKGYEHLSQQVRYYKNIVVEKVTLLQPRGYIESPVLDIRLSVTDTLQLLIELKVGSLESYEVIDWGGLSSTGVTAEGWLIKYQPFPTLESMLDFIATKLANNEAIMSEKRG